MNCHCSLLGGEFLFNTPLFGSLVVTRGEYDKYHVSNAIWNSKFWKQHCILFFEWTGAFNHATPLLRDKRNALKHGFHKPQAFNLDIHFCHTIYSTYVCTFYSVSFTTHSHRNWEHHINRKFMSYTSISEQDFNFKCTLWSLK